MAIEDFLDHKCDIYHIIETKASPGYNLPASSNFKYPETPDIAEVPCHFGVKGQTLTIVQQQPQNDMETEIKLTLPAGTDIRTNDQIRDCATGYFYTAKVPRNIRGHHTFAYIQRTTPQRAL